MSIKVSSKRYCMTPNQPFYLIGYGPRYKSRLTFAEGVHDDIFARALLLEVNQKKIFIINLDFIEVEEESCNEIKKLLNQTFGIAENLIFISTTHDHHSIMEYHKNWSTGKFSQAYYDFYVNTIIKAYQECDNSLEECQAFYGSGFIEGYYGSRIDYSDKADNQIIMVEFKNKHEKVIAALCNFATHSTVLSPENNLLTADFAGNLCNEIYKSRGVYPLMIVGAAGDSSNRGYRQGTDFKELERITKGVAKQIEYIVCDQSLDLTYQKDALVTYRVNYTVQDQSKELKERIAKLEKELEGKTDFQEIKLIKDDINSYQRKLNMKDIDVTLFSTILDLKDLEIVSSPGELGSKIGIDLKNHSKAKCCIICGYTNGYASYILQPELYENTARAIGSRYRKVDVINYVEEIKKNM